jgi:hypothetical protein
MGSHSNTTLQKHIDDSSTLIAKMAALTGELQTQLMNDFYAAMGIPLPSALVADVRQVQSCMVYTSDPVTDEFMSGAKTLLDGVFSGSYPDVADKALDVVQTLINQAVGSTSIQTGLTSQSLHIPATGDHGVFVAAAFNEVEECTSQEWLTETNFYVSFYAFVVWEPSPGELRVMESTRLAREERLRSRSSLA